MTALHLAVVAGRTDLAKQLLASLAAPDKLEQRGGRSPLYLATERNNQEMVGSLTTTLVHIPKLSDIVVTGVKVELLLCYGASQSCPSWAGATPTSLSSERRPTQLDC